MPLDRPWKYYGFNSQIQWICVIYKYIYIYIHKGITNDKCVVSLLKFILARGAVPAISG